MKINYRIDLLSRCIVSQILSFLGLLAAFVTTATAQEFNNIEYLCADWGPAMKLSAQTNAPPQFSDTEEEVYFIKQIGSFTRRRLPKPGLFSGATTEDIGKGLSIYLCKMKADGTEKTEVKELWRNPLEPIETQTQSCWMDVNQKTRKIALAIRYAASDLTGLWTMNLDGTDLNRIITPENNEKYLQSINHPSWTPDGQWIVFEEELRGPKPKQARIVKCGAEGRSLQRLTDGGRDEQPVVSPDGKRIAFIHWIIKGNVSDSWLWLMDLDGNNQGPLTNPDARPNWSAQAHWGTWPAWSPDGKKVYFIGTAATVCDAKSGKILWERSSDEHRPSWYHWGKSGFVGPCVGGLLFSDRETMKTSILAASHQSECRKDKPAEGRW